ncbi:MAG: amidohydrolase [Paracoccus sp. (in: a-proteobacteria)]|uniref:amidohydrolase n=1 Tax=Paracoccus sp. TaxID=267 RepID=UPI0026DF1784|nr:amidohydrolase [Paracoccus sp. (in: a-proteobacteria)]MDO5614105.1 amidohydrolase [Paracoccus sp. (in: a-proteobacteria)]
MTNDKYLQNLSLWAEANQDLPEIGQPGDGALIDTLIALRHRLHRSPDLSGDEGQTAALIAEVLRNTRPDDLLTGLGGHGVAAIWRGAAPGPTVMLRAELDGLPIHEQSDAPYRSTLPGKAHMCGHDGHMAILAGVATLIGARRPARGRVILLFQPAEENGMGAASVITDPRWPQIAPYYAFAIHNMPGVPLGHARLAPGAANCASRGLRLRLSGRTAHASQPDTGISPVPALAALIPALGALSHGSGPQDSGFRLATVTHARLGDASFGVAPGDAELWVTLRSRDDDGMADLLNQAQTLAQQTADTHRLGLTISHDDIFPACTNDARATLILQDALDAEGITRSTADLPMRASEDFGRFGRAGVRSAMVLLGAGDGPALHNPDYDFPDALIPVGLRLMRRVLFDLLD